MIDLVREWLSRGCSAAALLLATAALASAATVALGIWALRRKSPLMLGYAAALCVAPAAAGLSGAILVLMATFQPAAHGGPLAKAETLKHGVAVALAPLVIGTLLALPGVVTVGIARKKGLARPREETPAA